MLPLLFQIPGPVLTIAHRGFSSKFPENTLAAFRGAIEQKVDMIELDIQLSKDNVPVIFHDAKLNNHSDGKGKVADYTLNELQKMDVGSWFSSAYSSERIPTLEEVLQLAKGTIALNIEIKTEAVRNEIEHGVEQLCLQLVNKYKLEEHVLFSSFDGRAVHHLKQLNPEIPVAILYSDRFGMIKNPAGLVHKYMADAFNCSYRKLTNKRFQDLKSHQIPVFVYTVDQPVRMEKLIKKGVDGIFTNHPQVLQNIINDLDQNRSHEPKKRD